MKNEIEDNSQEQSPQEEISIEQYRALLDVYLIEIELGVDITNKIVYVSGEINENTLQRLISQINMLSRFDAELESITLYINSFGGDAYEAIGIIDYIESLPFKVNAICYGKAMSAGALILCGVTGERSISKHSSLMLHELLSDSYGSSSQTKVRTEHLKNLENIIVDVLIRKSSKSKAFWKKKLLPDLYLSSYEAEKLGLIDKII